MDQQTPGQLNLPYSRLTLLLGIFSLLSFFFIGLLLGIITLLTARKAHIIYSRDPESYTLNSYNRVAVGKICAIIALIIGSFFLLYSLMHYFLFGNLFDF